MPNNPGANNGRWGTCIKTPRARICNRSSARLHARQLTRATMPNASVAVGDASRAQTWRCGLWRDRASVRLNFDTAPRTPPRAQAVPRWYYRRRTSCYSGQTHDYRCSAQSQCQQPYYYSESVLRTLTHHPTLFRERDRRCAAATQAIPTMLKAKGAGNGTIALSSATTAR